MEEGLLTIKAEREETKEEKEKNYRRKEYSFESFERFFRLPENVDADDVKAKYDDGVLKITLKKTKMVEPEKKVVKVA